MSAKNRFLLEAKRRQLEDDEELPWGEELPTGGILDYVAVQLLFENVIKFDTCGVLEDVTNFILFPGQDQTPVEEITNNIVANDNYVAYREDGNRNLQEHSASGLRQCTDEENVDFSAKALDFVMCSGFDLLGVIMNWGDIQTISSTIVSCVNSVFYSTAGRVCSKGDRFDDFRDTCVQGFLDNNVIGELVRQILIKPGLTCDCASILLEIPDCAMTDLAGGLVDGVLMKRLSCALQEQFCPYIQGTCGGRINKLNTCLPSYEVLSRDGYGTNADCFDVLCECEKIDTGDFNFPGELMGLPLADMCINEIEQDYPDHSIIQRFTKFQQVCADSISPGDQEYTPKPITSQPTPKPTNNLQANSLEAGISNNAGMATGTFLSGVLVGCAFLAICAILVVAIVAVSRHYIRRRDDDSYDDDDDSEYDDEED